MESRRGKRYVKERGGGRGEKRREGWRERERKEIYKRERGCVWVRRLKKRLKRGERGG